MKRLFFILLLAFVFPAFAQDDGQFSELTGLPVMEGLTENVDARLVFDKPEGRIIEAHFTGSGPVAGVMDFYRDTLFQLGWVLNQENSTESFAEFLREGERLTIEVTGIEPLEVTLEVGPSEGGEAG